MADNKKILDLPDSIPSGGFNFIVATGIENYRVPYIDVAEYSSIGTKTGQFTDSLSLSGSPVIPTNNLVDGNITYYSGERIRGDNSRLTINAVGVGINDSNPNYTLEVGGDLNVKGDILTGGAILNVVSEQLTISGALITVNSGEPGAGVTTDLAGLLVDRGTLPSGYMLFTESYKGWSPSHNFVVTGGLNLGIGTTTPTSAIHMTSGKLTALTGEFSKSLTISGFDVAIQDVTTALSGNLATTGAHLHEHIDLVSGNLIATGAHLTSEIATVSGNVDTVSGDVNGILTTGLSTESGVFSKALTISGAPVITGISSTNASVPIPQKVGASIWVHSVKKTQAVFGSTLASNLGDVTTAIFVWGETDEGTSDHEDWDDFAGPVSMSPDFLAQGGGGNVQRVINSRRINGLSNGTKFYARVKYVAGGTAYWSDAISFTTSTVGPKDIPFYSSDPYSVSPLAPLITTGQYNVLDERYSHFSTRSLVSHIASQSKKARFGFHSNLNPVQAKLDVMGDLANDNCPVALFNSGNVGIGNYDPQAQLDVTGQILATSGAFSEALTISGVAVSTGAEGKWADGVDAGDIYYSGGNVGISGDLRVSGNAYFTPETIYVGQAPVSSDGTNLSGHGLVLNNPTQIRPDYNQGTGSFSNPVYNSITPSGYLTVKRTDSDKLEISAFASSEIFGDLAGSNIIFYYGTADGTRIIEGLDLWQNQSIAHSGYYCALTNTWVRRVSISDITKEIFVGVKFENGAFEGYPFGVARTNVAVEDMLEEKSEQVYLANFFAQSSLKLSPTIPGLQNVQFSGISGNFSESLTISGVSVSTGVGGGTPGGSDTNIQFNEGGSFGGSDYLTYDYNSEFISGASGIFDYFSGHTGYFRDYASGATGDWDFTTGSTGHWKEEVIVGTGADVALIANDSGDVGIGWSGTPAQPIGAQLHVSGSTIISGSSEITLDYDRLPKSNPNIKGRVWLEVVSGFLMISSGIASDPPIIVSRQFLTRLAAGAEHSLFLTISGDVYAAGGNTHGQLGDGTTVDKDVPTYITGDVSGIAAGGYHSMFISTGGGAYACGANTQGELGDGTTVQKNVPTYITGDVTGMVGGYSHSIFLSTSGGVYTFGSNTYGQLGDGTTDQKNVPTYITGDVTGVAAKGDHSMFLSTGSGAYACGLNTYSQLGDGSSVNKDVPTYITGDVSGIAAGGYHSMFISTGNDAYACGGASFGQLGNGSTGPNMQVPTYITGDVSGIAGGYSHSIFLSTGSGAYACGLNNLGQLGDGTTVNKLVPTYITGDVTEAAGYYQSIFLSNTGGLYTCGYNNKGQLGDGSTVNKDVLTYISGLGA